MKTKVPIDKLKNRVLVFVNLTVKVNYLKIVFTLINTDFEAR